MSLMLFPTTTTGQLLLGPSQDLGMCEGHSQLDLSWCAAHFPPLQLGGLQTASYILPALYRMLVLTPALNSPPVKLLTFSNNCAEKGLCYTGVVDRIISKRL